MISVRRGDQRFNRTGLRSAPPPAQEVRAWLLETGADVVVLCMDVVSASEQEAARLRSNC